VKDKNFVCPEVTIGWFGKERVDLLTYDTKGIFRCYEVKSSKSDFYSKCAHTFIGHYNYFVMSLELFEQVKKDIPKGIGCYCPDKYGNMISRLKASKNEVSKKTFDTLKDSMIRSLYREASKYLFDDRDEEIRILKSQLSKSKKHQEKYESV
jgi:hypothetical protein